MINLRSEFFTKCAEVVASSFSKSTASAKSSMGGGFKSRESTYPKGNPSVSLNNTMAKFHKNHDLEDLNKKGIKPPDAFTSGKIDLNNKGLSHLPERRLLLAHLRGR